VDVINKLELLCERFKFISMIECGVGWFELIQKMCEEIEKTENAHKLPQLYIKEKFGRLRVYTSSFEDSSYMGIIDNILKKYEHLSTTICEDCGQAGKLTTVGYWLSTICDACKEIYDNKK